MKKLLVMLLALALVLSSMTFAVAEDRELYVIEILTGNSDWEMSNEMDVGKYIEEKFGIVFKNIYYAGDMREKQSTNLAAGEIGEIVGMMRNDMVSAYYNAGVLYNLEEHLDEMPNFANRYADQLERWRHPTGGVLYKWESNTPDMNYESCELLIRSDILELNDWKMPATMGELTALLEKAMADRPMTVDGLPVVGMTAPLAEPWGLQGIAGIGYEKGGHYLAIGNEGVTFDWTTDEFVDYFLCPDVKESLKAFNTMYQNGTLDIECFTDFSAQTSDKMATGQALAVWYVDWSAADANVALEAAGLTDYQYVKTFIQLDSQAANGEPRSFKIETARPIDSFAITTSCKQPERVLELIEWACSEEGQTILQCGFEGVTYTVNEEGVRVPTDALLNSTSDDRIDWGLGKLYFLPHDKSKSASDGQFYYIMSESLYKDILNLTERQKEAYAKMGFEYSMQWGDEHGVFIDTGSAGTVTLDSTTEFAKIQQQMIDCRVKYSAKLIMAESDADFDKVWDEAVAEYNLLDHESVVAEYNRLYAETKK